MAAGISSPSTSWGPSFVWREAPFLADLSLPKTIDSTLERQYVDARLKYSRKGTPFQHPEKGALEAQGSTPSFKETAPGRLRPSPKPSLYRRRHVFQKPGRDSSPRKNSLRTSATKLYLDWISTQNTSLWIVFWNEGHYSEYFGGPGSQSWP